MTDSSASSESSSETQNRTLSFQDLLLDFLLSLFDDPISDSEYKSPLISGLAVLGIGEDSKWLEAKNYTTILSSIITISRFFVLLKATNQRALAQKQASTNQTLTVQSHYTYTKKLAEKFLILASYNSEPYPFDWIIKLRAYGLAIRYNTSEIGSIYWIDDTVYYQDIELSISTLRTFIAELLADAQSQLYTSLLFIDPEIELLNQLPPIELSELWDNPTDSDPDFTFLRDSRNIQFGSTDSDWLLKRILSNISLSQEFVSGYKPGDPKLIWNRPRIQLYFSQIRSFKELLLVLVHLTSGGPARGTELLTIRFRNSLRGELRGVFIESNLVALVTIYHKNYSSSAKLKVIHRYLPKEVSLLIIYYLWLVEPFSYSLSLFLSESDPTAIYRSPYI